MRKNSWQLATSIALAIGLVACGGGGGEPIPVPTSTASENVAPVANAGVAQNVVKGSVVTLDGSASSDANGDPLTYVWTLTSKPAGSAAVLSSATSAKPTFTADAAGTFVATLVVNDGRLNSAQATVAVTAAVVNVAPVANAGVAQNVVKGSVVTLDGSASSDANGDPLTYVWTLTSKPAGSAAVLSSATSAKPTFTADAAGTFVATLVVNDGRLNSAQATVAVTAAVVNVAPVANAGVAQNVVKGSVVTLDGSASSDANGDPLTYVWTLTSKPAGSAAVLSSATSAKPTFTADAAGTFVATLVVNDGRLNSAQATVAVTAAVVNVAPVANAGVAQIVPAGAWIVNLDGGASSDANGDPLTYKWVFISVPAGSAPSPFTSASQNTATNPSFWANVPGTYVISLVVNDGKADSAPSTVVITAGTPVSGQITGSVTWTKSASPYVFVGDLMIPFGSTLSVDTGVQIEGKTYKAQVEGSLIVNGIISDRVAISNLSVVPVGKISNNHLINVKGAAISGGSFYAWPQSSYGTLILSDSTLINVPTAIFLWYPMGVNAVDRNVFTNSGGISYGLSPGTSLSIRNNRFTNTTNWSGVSAVENWAYSSTAVASVSKNSFLSTDRIAIRLPAGYSGSAIDAANNYWGTTSTTVIDQMIFDRNDDLTSGGIVNYTPYLTNPDPLTP